MSLDNCTMIRLAWIAKGRKPDQRIRKNNRTSSLTMTSRILVIAVSVLFASACNQVKPLLPKTTISGEYRAPSVDDPAGKVGSELMYDLRSDGTFTMHHSMSILGTSTSSTGKGTYVIKGRKVELTQTSFTVNDETTEHISHETLSLEDNGDLIRENGLRLKKQ